VCVGLAASAARSEGLPEALAKAYQTNPLLNAERARQRATDENVPQALAGYRPQIVASLSAGLQAVRDLLPGNTFQSGNLKPWTVGVTVTQTLFNGFKTANSVRVAVQVQSGREALRNVGQGVLLDAVTAYTNAGQSTLVERFRQRRIPRNPGHRAEASQCRRRRRPTPRRPGAAQPRATDLEPPRSASPSARRPTPR
jgi:outer membrane protein